jgi:hypothetical protein
MPRLLATHLVWGCYGFWLPNDPRGSWSRYVGSRPIHEVAGRATTVDTDRSLAKRSHDLHHRRSAKQALHDHPTRLDGTAARDVALAVGDAARWLDLTIFALVVMPDHVHAVVGRSPLRPRELMAKLKSRATRRLNDHRLNPRPDGTPWCKGGWNVLLYDERSVDRAI